MATGPIVLSVFAAIWAIVGLLTLGVAPWAAVLAAIPSAGMIIAAVRLGRELPARGEAEARRIGRLVGVWSGIEGVAIFAGIVIVANLGHPELNAAVMCLAVGLHFFPLARGLPRRSLYLPGMLLTALGVAGMLFASTLPATAVDLLAAAGLWLAALLGIADMWRIIAGQTKL